MMLMSYTRKEKTPFDSEILGCVCRDIKNETQQIFEILLERKINTNPCVNFYIHSQCSVLQFFTGLQCKKYLSDSEQFEVKHFWGYRLADTTIVHSCVTHFSVQ